MAEAAQPTRYYPCANFALAAGVRSDGRLLFGGWQNSGRLGESLSEWAGGKFAFAGADEKFVDDVALARRELACSWPFARLAASDPSLGEVEIDSLAWCPLGPDDAFTSSLPAVLVEMTFRNKGPLPAKISCRHSCADIIGADCEISEAQNRSVVVNTSGRAAAFDRRASWDAAKGEMTVSFKIPAAGATVLRFAQVHFDPNFGDANLPKSPEKTVAYALKYWEVLKLSTELFEAGLPTMGDKFLDDATRAYSLAGTILTRILRTGEILTMGYRELNQRDSFWTSWIHLAMWHSLERRMIEESAEHQRPDGKIPSCILPVIERDDDVDMNCYFVLRVHRYRVCRFDDELLRAQWPAVARALDWLIARSPDGLPQQRSFWYDWKDVKGVEGRLYSPYAAALYLAALKRGITDARRLKKSPTRFIKALKKGEALLNKSVEEGGLWDEKAGCYKQVWHDGRRCDKVLQDQVVGALYKVFPPDRAAKVLDALEGNWCDFGVRETWPYYAKDFGYEPGEYHNGGVWPWLCFVEAWARIRAGQKEKAMEIVRRVFNADMAAPGDYLPHEYLSAETGANKGFPIQGWNACLFGLVHFDICDRFDVL